MLAKIDSGVLETPAAAEGGGVALLFPKPTYTLRSLLANVKHKTVTHRDNPSVFSSVLSYICAAFLSCVSPHKSRLRGRNTALASAGISETANTFARWRDLGYEVMHGSKALFGVSLIWGARGDGAEYKASFFGESQVRATA